jgi:hypothetical protein
MAFNAQTSLLPLYFVLSDSHATFVPSLTTSSYQIIVKSISGLSWLNKKKSHLSATSQIQTATISSYISSSKSILLLIGTNSIRFSTAAYILNQVKDFILLLRNHHPHLIHKTSINIVATFPCRKTTNSFPTYASFRANIHSYNQQLLTLSNNLNFTVVDFQVTYDHLSDDNIHLHKADHVKNQIFKYFTSLTHEPPATPIKTSRRSIEALAHRNKRAHQKLAEKQQFFQLKRSIIPPWTVKHAKQYLKKQEIRFAKLPPIHKNILRIQFNDSISLEAATKALPEDIFSETFFFQCFPS